MKLRSGPVLAILLTANVIAGSFSVSARADQQEVAVPATGQLDTQAPSVLDDFYVNYFAIYHGASVTQMGSPFQADRNGLPSKFANVNLDSELTTAYMITKDIGIGPVIPFYAYPVMGRGIDVGDVGIKAFDAATIKTRNLSVYTNLYVQAPTNSFSQARNMSWALKTTPYIRYGMGRFTVGAWTEAKDYFSVTQYQTFKLYGAPYVSYTLTPRRSSNAQPSARS